MEEKKEGGSDSIFFTASISMLGSQGAGFVGNKKSSSMCL